MKTTPISPKVIVAVIVGIVLSALVSNASAITPDMLNFLGPWKLFVLGTGLAILMGLSAWWKSDPLRVIPDPSTTDGSGTAATSAEDSKQASLAATAPVVTPAPAPFVSTQTGTDALPDVPAPVFPKAAVDAALAAAEPAPEPAASPTA